MKIDALFLSNCCERNAEIARDRGRDMEQTNRAYECNGEYLTIPLGDYEGLTLSEVSKIITIDVEELNT